MSLPAPSARSMLSSWAAAPETEQELASGALLIAAEEYPQLVIAHYLRRLDLLAERVRDRLGDEAAPLVAIQELNHVLFQEEGLRGNAGSYFDPRNSFLNDVLDRRLGIPITLSIVYLEVAWRLGVPLRGVNFPGHFLVGYEGEAVRFLVDPFESGRLRFEDEAQELLDRVYGGMIRLQREFLAGVSKRDMLVRLLSNLKGIYMNARDDRRALAAVERILVLRPGVPGEIRDRGMLLARCGRTEEAIADLEAYLASMPHAPDARRIQLLIQELEDGRQP